MRFRDYAHHLQLISINSVVSQHATFFLSHLITPHLIFPWITSSLPQPILTYLTSCHTSLNLVICCCNKICNPFVEQAAWFIKLKLYTSSWHMTVLNTKISTLLTSLTIPRPQVKPLSVLSLHNPSLAQTILITYSRRQITFILIHFTIISHKYLPLYPCKFTLDRHD